MYTPSSSDKSEGAKATQQSVLVTVRRKQRGPATTLSISCDQLGISPFTLDLVNSLHARQLRYLHS